MAASEGRKNEGCRLPVRSVAFVYVRFVHEEDSAGAPTSESLVMCGVAEAESVVCVAAVTGCLSVLRVVRFGCELCV